MKRKIGERILRLEIVESTNDYAKRIARDVPEGTVVVAGRQTSGRGRKGRKWASPEGGLWTSVILKPPMIDPRLVFVGALAVTDTLAEFGIEGSIKWPNDVWVSERKIAGILTEGKAGEYVILGIGLNVNNSIPEELKDYAVSMKDILKQELPLDDVLRILIDRLNEWYDLFLHNPKTIVEAVRERTFVIGKDVIILDGNYSISGRVLDIIDDGSLLVDVDGQLRRILTGDVSLRIRHKF